MSLSLGASADESAKDAKPDSQHAKQENTNSESSWYVFMGNVNNHPRLRQAQDEIHRRIDRPLRLVAPGFEDVKTFADQRDDFLIWTPFIGAGKVLSERWDVFVQMGYSAGKVRTHETYPSLLLLPLHVDAKEYRSSFFAGLGAAFFPMGVPELQKYCTLKDRLKAARPFLVSTLSWNYLTFEAKVKAGLLPFDSLIRIDDKRDWNPFSSGLGVGMDVPLSKSSALSFNAQYTFFFDQGADFSGPGFSSYFKKYF